MRRTYILLYIEINKIFFYRLSTISNGSHSEQPKKGEKKKEQKEKEKIKPKNRNALMCLIYFYL